MLEYNVEWSRDALDDLDYYWGTVLEESRDPDTAEAFVNRMIDYAEESCRRPYNGFVVDVLKNENMLYNKKTPEEIAAFCNCDLQEVKEVQRKMRVNI